MPRGGFGLQQSQRQFLVHTAAWSTYVPGVSKATGNPFGPQSRAQALRSLRDLWPEITQDGDRSELMLTATALWNLLDVYRKDPVPKEFSKLLLAVLALDVERARELHIQPPHWVFPPFPEDARLDPDTYAEFGATPLVAESSFTVRRNKKSEPFRAHANLQLCVRRDFDRLRFLAQPERWPELCSVIWTDMKREEVDIWKGGLRLPGIPEQEVIDVTFKDATISEPDANKMVVELTLAAPPFIEAGYLKFRMEPERERPGWTRIIHDREVTFFSELHRYEVPTLAYWTKSEIACLALS